MKYWLERIKGLLYAQFHHFRDSKYALWEIMSMLSLVTHQEAMTLLAVTLSWPSHERPTIEKMRETAKVFFEELSIFAESAGKAIDLSCLRSIEIGHGDTNNLHLHLLLCLVDPKTHRPVQLANGLFRIAVQCALRRVEKRMSWKTYENAPDYEYSRQDGRFEFFRLNPGDRSLSPGQRDYEVRSKKKSPEPKLHSLLKNKTPAVFTGWEDFIGFLRKHGIRYCRWKKGAVFQFDGVCLSTGSIWKLRSLESLWGRMPSPILGVDEKSRDTESRSPDLDETTFVLTRHQSDDGPAVSQDDPARVSEVNQTECPAVNPEPVAPEANPTHQYPDVVLTSQQTSDDPVVSRDDPARVFETNQTDSPAVNREPAANSSSRYPEIVGPVFDLHGWRRAKLAKQSKTEDDKKTRAADLAAERSEERRRFFFKIRHGYFPDAPPEERARVEGERMKAELQSRAKQASDVLAGQIARAHQTVQVYSYSRSKVFVGNVINVGAGLARLLVRGVGKAAESVGKVAKKTPKMLKTVHAFLSSPAWPVADQINDFKHPEVKQPEVESVNAESMNEEVLRGLALKDPIYLDAWNQREQFKRQVAEDHMSKRDADPDHKSQNAPPREH